MLYITLSKALYPGVRDLSLHLIANMTALDALVEAIPALTIETNAAYSGELTYTLLRARMPYLLEQTARLAALFEDADARGLQGDGHYLFEATERMPTNWVGHVAINLKYTTDPKIMRGRGRSDLNKIIADSWDARLKKLQLTDAERERFDTWRTKGSTVLTEIHKQAEDLYHHEATKILWQPARAANGHTTENPQSVVVE